MMNRFPHFLILLLLAGSGSVLRATTVSFTAAADTTLFSAYADNNFGQSTLETGTNGVGAPGRALLRFDLSSIPAGATITSVEFSMTVVKIPPGDQHAGAIDSDYLLYRMLVPWQEGTGGGQSGAFALPGEVTWNERGAGGVAAWSTPGGQIGTDFANSADTSTTVGTDFGPLVWGSTPDFVADAQSWLDDPSTNYGFITISDQENQPGTARRLASRESAGGSIAPPTLTVTFSLVPEPGTGLLIVAGMLCCSGRIRRVRR